MRIGTIGGSGFVGRAIQRAIVSRGWELRAISRDDLSEPPEHCADRMRGCDWIVNSAGAKKVRSPDDHYVNELLPAKLYRLASDAGCTGFLHVSSVAALSSVTPPQELFGDLSIAVPNTLYGRSKLEGEERLRDVSAPQVKLCILRPPILFGLRAGGPFAVLRLLASRGAPLPIKGINSKRSFMFVENFSEDVIGSLEGGLDGTFITTDSAPVTPAGLYAQMLRARGLRDRSFNIGPLMTLARYVLGSRGSSLFDDASFEGQRFRDTVGRNPRYSFEEAILKSMPSEKESKDCVAPPTSLDGPQHQTQIR